MIKPSSIIKQNVCSFKLKQPMTDDAKYLNHLHPDHIKQAYLKNVDDPDRLGL